MNESSLLHSNSCVFIIMNYANLYGVKGKYENRLCSFS